MRGSGIIVVLCTCYTFFIYSFLIYFFFYHSAWLGLSAGFSVCTVKLIEGNVYLNCTGCSWFRVLNCLRYTLWCPVGYPVTIMTHLQYISDFVIQIVSIHLDICWPLWPRKDHTHSSIIQRPLQSWEGCDTFISPH